MLWSGLIVQTTYCVSTPSSRSPRGAAGETWASRSSRIDRNDLKIGDQARKRVEVHGRIGNGSVDLGRIRRCIRERGVNLDARDLQVRGRPRRVTMQATCKSRYLPDSQACPLQIGLTSNRRVPKLTNTDLA